MKKTLFAVVLVAAFSFSAFAASAPSLTAKGNGRASRGTSTPTWGIPSVPSTIIFYGGDINVNDPNAQGFANGNTLAVPDSSTYGAVTAPKGSKVTVSGIFFNNSPNVSGGTVFDPATGTYDIRIKVSEGVGGTSVASGSGAQTAVLTGRDPFGLTEYTNAVQFAKSLTATAGTTYWVNETPQCTNSGNGNCSAEFMYVSNTTQKTNSVNGSAQPSSQIYLNSAYFGFTWANWCDAALGQSPQQCAFMSFGLTK